MSSSASILHFIRIFILHSTVICLHVSTVHPATVANSICKLIRLLILQVYSIEYKLTVPPKAATGICSTKPTVAVKYTAVVDSPGAYSVYLLEKKYLSLLVHNRTSAEVYYYVKFSCVSEQADALITFCEKSNSELKKNIYCIGFRNDGNEALKASLDVDFGADESPPASSKPSTTGTLAEDGSPSPAAPSASSPLNNESKAVGASVFMILNLIAIAVLL